MKQKEEEKCWKQDASSLRLLHREFSSSKDEQEEEGERRIGECAAVRCISITDAKSADDPQTPFTLFQLQYPAALGSLALALSLSSCSPSDRVSLMRSLAFRHELLLVLMLHS